MATVTLEQIHNDLIEIKEEMFHLRAIVEEDFPLSAETDLEIEKSRHNPRSSFVSHEEMRKEFG
ncbi:hypothetical protein HYU14_05880 [Candidatus Woesearchaeota archaeon]|nr:hypothetical protein [Candidatus Woesearchaeota archaeon]